MHITASVPAPPRIILRLPDVMRGLGIGRSLIYEHARLGLLPPPVPLGARAVGWPSDEIADVIAARVAGAGEVEIKALVAGLVAARKGAR